MLVTLKEILKDAKEQKYAVGAFNVPNLESIMAVIEAAEEMQVPVILAHAHNQEYVVPIEVIGPVMLEFAKNAKVPVCVHADHGASFSFCMRAIRQGFTSVMYDGSALSFEENVKNTCEVVKAAHAVGVSVEAELGHIFVSSVGAGEGRAAKSAEDYENLEDAYTDPEKAREFVEATGIDALAIAFGTTHGIYVKKPKLDLERITKIKRSIDIPFVMHGGSGVPEEGFRTAIRNGITKINYYTYMGKAGGEAAAHFADDQRGRNEVLFYHDIAMTGTKAMRENVKEALRVFSGKS